ncbi:17161_t:CDS:2, partial [Racocetra fulgida]
KGSILAVAGEIDFHLEQLNNREKTHIGEAPTEQEAQTERMFKSTFRQFLDKSIEPSMFNANTIDHHYSLGEFFNRLTEPIFFYRVEHTNNKAKLAANGLSVQWHKYGNFGTKQ